MKCMLAVIKDMDFLWKVLWIINMAFYHVQGLPNLIRIGKSFLFIIFFSTFLSYVCVLNVYAEYAKYF